MLAVSEHGFVIGAHAGEVLGVTDAGAFGGVGADAKLLLVGVSREQVYVSEMGWIALAQVRHESAQPGKRSSPRFISKVVGLQRGMVFHPRDEGVELGALRRIVEHLGPEQVTREHRSQVMTGRDLQPLCRRPSQIETLCRHPGQRFVGGRWRAPKRDEELFLYPASRPR